MRTLREHLNISGPAGHDLFKRSLAVLLQSLFGISAQSKIKRGAVVDFTFSPYAASMSLDDAFDNG